MIATNSVYPQPEPAGTDSMAADNDHKVLLEKIEALEKEAAARNKAELHLKQQSEFLFSVLESLAQPL